MIKKIEKQMTSFIRVIRREWLTWKTN